MIATASAYQNTALMSAHYQPRHDKFSLFLFCAALLHAVAAFAVGFSMPEPAALPTPTLDVVLLQQPLKETENQDADYLAEFSQAGGGESQQKTRPKDFFSASQANDENGIAPENINAGSSQAQKKRQQFLLTSIYANTAIHINPQEERREHQSERAEELSDIDLKIAKMSAELSQKQEKYAKRPKKLQLTASTAAHFAAGYMGRWVERIERIGNLNIPPAARRLNGELVLMVELKHDGTLVRTKIMQSSGHSVLDETAKRIVFLSTPYEAFPPKLRAQADHIEIVRTWHFSNLGLSTRFSDEKR